MNTHRKEILLIEDNEADAMIFEEMLESISAPKFNLQWKDSLKGGINFLKSNHIDLILLDLSLPESSGLETLQKIINVTPLTPLIILTGSEDSELPHKALNEGAQDFLQKRNLNSQLLVKSISYAIERAKMNDDLRKNEELFRNLYENANVGIYRTSAEGKIIIANKALIEMLGFDSLEDLSQRNLEKEGFNSVDSRERFIDKFKDSDVVIKHRAVWEKKDHAYLFVRESARAVRNEKGEIIYFDGTVEDITSIVQHEKSLELSEERFRNLVEEDITADFISTVGGKILLCNNAFIKMFGFNSKEEALMTNASELYYKEGERESFLNLILKNKKVELYEVELKKRSGEKIIALENVFGEFDEHGALIRIKGYMFDITERKAAEKQLVESEAKYRQLIENAEEIILTTDSEGYFTFANSAALKFSGYSFEEITSFHFLDIVHEDYKSKVRNFYFRQFLEKNETSAFRFPFYTKLGEVKWLEQNVRLNKSGDKVSGFQFIARDVTERIIADKLLHDQTRLLVNVLNVLPIGLWIQDKNGKLIHANPAGQKIWAGAKYVGMDQFGEYKGWRLNSGELIQPDEWAAARAIRNRETSLNEEIEIECFDGTHKIILNSAVPIIDSKNELQGAIIVNVDITEKKKAEMALHDSEAKFRALAETTSSAIFMFRGEMMIYANPAAEKLSGYSHEEILNKKFWDVVHPEFKSIVINRGLARQAGEKISDRYEVKIIRKDGEVRWIDFSAGLINYEGMPTVLGTAFDITERKRAESALIESETKFRVLAETAASAIFIYRGEKFIYTNPAGEELSGFNANELYLKNFWDIVHDDFKEMIMERGLARQRGENVPNRYEFKIVRKDGTERWVDFTAGVVDYNGEPAALGTAFDITDKKVAEEALGMSEKKYRQLFEANPYPMWVYDLHSLRFLAVNEAAVHHYGYSKEEFLSMTIKDIRPAEDIPKLLHSINHAGEIDRAGIWNHTKKDGTKIKVDIISHKIDFAGRDADLVLAWDVTEKLQAEEEILKLSQAVKQNPAAIVITNTEGLIEYVNPKYEELTGYSLEEVRGKKTSVLKSGHTLTEDYEKLWSTIKSGKEWRGEFHNKKKNGELFWASVLISPIRNGGGKIKYFLAIKEDITEKKKLLQDLIDAKDKAEEMNRVKSYFFANMSHELRTPFVGILGFAELLHDSVLESDNKEMIEKIIFSARRMQDTLTKILEVTNLEFSDTRVYKKEIDIVEMINRIYNSYYPSASVKNLSFEKAVAFQTLSIKSDERFLAGILTNVLDNAIKYTNEGWIKISCEVENVEEVRSLIIKVSDTGIGIPFDKQEIIFTEFRQVSEGLNRTFEGTGLGLTIAKKFATLLGGNLAVDSSEGQGSTFTLIIPLDDEINTSNLNKIRSKEKFGGLPKRKLSAKKVLYVEDDPINADVVRLFLSKYYEIDISESADHSLIRLKEKKYNLILLDINLGAGMTGVELFQFLKKDNYYKNIPIVAVTAFAQQSEKDLFMNLGLSGFITKPYRLRELLKKVDEAIGK